MKEIRTRYEGSVLKTRGLCIFCAFFLLYVFLGMCISYQNLGDFYQQFSDANIYFGADNQRAFVDLTCINDSIYHHYRIHVHPLFLLLAQTITLLVDGVVNRPSMSVILMGACCGALSVFFFDTVLGRRGAERRLRTLFTLIFGFSFSHIIFSTVPETFIFSGLGLISFWYFLSAASESKGPLSKREKFLLVFFGAVNFGGTLTNYVFYSLGLAFLLLCRYKPMAGAKAFFKLSALNAAVSVAANLYQKFAWGDAPLFWDNMLSSLISGEPYHETSWMNWAFNRAKTVEWIKGTMLRPFLSPSIYLKDLKTGSHLIMFSGYGVFLKAVLVLFWAALILCLAVWLAARLRRFEWKRDGYILCLLAAYAGNLVLHYIYGYNEAYMYSPHYLFYILLAAALALERGGVRKLGRVLAPGLLAFWAVEALNNLDRFFETARIALGTVGASVGAGRAAMGTVLCGALLLAALLGWDRLRHGTRPSPPGKENAAVQTLYRAVMVYLALVFVPSLFIAFNH